MRDSRWIESVELVVGRLLCRYGCRQSAPARVHEIAQRHRQTNPHTQHPPFSPTNRLGRLTQRPGRFLSYFCDGRRTHAAHRRQQDEFGCCVGTLTHRQTHLEPFLSEALQQKPGHGSALSLFSLSMVDQAVILLRLGFQELCGDLNW